MENANGEREEPGRADDPEVGERAEDRHGEAVEEPGADGQGNAQTIEPAGWEHVAAPLYLNLIDDQIAEERARKDSLERRGAFVVTSSGALVSLGLGVAAVASHRDATSLPSPAVLTLFAALASFAWAIYKGIRSNYPSGEYEEPTVASLRRSVESYWTGDRVKAGKAVADAMLSSLEAARTVNEAKARTVHEALRAEGAAFALLALTVVLLMVSEEALSGGGDSSGGAWKSVVSGGAVALFAFWLAALWDVMKSRRDEGRREKAVMQATRDEIAALHAVVLDNQDLVKHELTVLAEGKILINPLDPVEAGFWELVRVDPPKALFRSPDTLSRIRDVARRTAQVNGMIRSREDYRNANSAMSNFNERLESYDRLLDRFQGELLDALDGLKRGLDT